MGGKNRTEWGVMGRLLVVVAVVGGGNKGGI